MEFDRFGLGCCEAGGEAACGQQGVVVWSDVPGLLPSPHRGGHGPTATNELLKLSGPRWRQNLAKLAASMSPKHTAMCMAAQVCTCGAIDPFQTIPLDQFCTKTSTPWLPDVLEREALQPFFQPIVDLTEGRTIGFEALARVKLRGRYVTGAELVAASRAHRAFRQFDRIARDQAVAQGAPLLRTGEWLFVNFMPSMVEDDFASFASCWEMARRAGCLTESLVFEIVETDRLQDMAHVRGLVEHIRERGARVAIDDLGAPHTALTYMDEIRPDIVKLDRSLVRPDLAANSRLVGGIVEYAHAHGMTVVAEGIETLEQLHFAREIGADFGQGWLFGRPCAAMHRARATSAA